MRIFILSNNILYANINIQIINRAVEFLKMEDQEELVQKLAEYRSEHAALDEAIERTMNSGQPVNLFNMQQLKKKKLWLKDMIQKIESDLIDDIIA